MKQNDTFLKDSQYLRNYKQTNIYKVFWTQSKSIMKGVSNDNRPHSNSPSWWDKMNHTYPWPEAYIPYLSLVNQWRTLIQKIQKIALAESPRIRGLIKSPRLSNQILITKSLSREASLHPKVLSTKSKTRPRANQTQKGASPHSYFLCTT